MFDPFVIIYIGVMISVTALQLYLLDKDTPIYFDIIIPIFLTVFAIVSYIDDIVYVAGQTEIVVANSTTVNANVTRTTSTISIVPVYKPNPFVGYLVLGFVFVIASYFILLLKIFGKRGSLESI